MTTTPLSQIRDELRSDPYAVCHRAEFDHPFRITDTDFEDGLPDVWAPDLYEGELDSEGWEFVNGYSGQYLYSGPIMHNSEFLGGCMAQDVLDTPGVYVCVVSYYEPEDDEPDGELYAEGWALLRQVS